LLQYLLIQNLTHLPSHPPETTNVLSLKHYQPSRDSKSSKTRKKAFTNLYASCGIKYSEERGIIAMMLRQTMKPPQEAPKHPRAFRKVAR
jgi:hypothetical protein